MTETYRQRELIRANSEWKKARKTYQTTTVKANKREAAEMIEFWANKRTFLSAIDKQD